MRRRLFPAASVHPVLWAASPHGSVHTNSSSSGVQSRVPGTSVQRALCAALILRRISALSGQPRSAALTPSRTCAGRGLPRLAAAIFSQRFGPPVLATPFFLASTADGSRV